MDKVRSKEEVVDRTLFEAGQPDPSQQIRFSWMNERLHVLCCAGLGWAGRWARCRRWPGPPSHARANSWRVHDQAQKNEPVPDVEAGIVQERYAAIQWLLCYEDLDRDDIAGEA